LRQVECVPRHPLSDRRDLSGPSGADIRPALLRELTDLYVQKPSHSVEEERHFIELALRLIDHVDAAERARLGSQLAAYPGAPLAILRRLATPQSPVPMAQPSGLPRIESPASPETLSDAFFNAAPAERRLILLNLDYSPVGPAPLQSPPGTIAALERSALNRQRDTFAATLERSLSVSARCARRIADDASGEAIVVALKALDVPAPAVQRVLMFLNPAIGQSADIFFLLVRLYDEIDAGVARRMVAIWRRDSASARAGRHQTQFFDDRPALARDFTRHEARPGDTPFVHIPSRQSRAED
jgi:uncharacterized protein (DUF2336 family)